MAGFTHEVVIPIRLKGKSHAAGSKVSLSPPEAEDLSRGPYPAVEPLGDTEAQGTEPQGDGEAAGEGEGDTGGEAPAAPETDTTEPQGSDGSTTPAPKSKGKK